MSVNVSFFKYTGKPNEVPKTLSSGTVKTVNFITDNFPCLEMTIELKDLLDVNYCTFQFQIGSQTRSYYWFITNIEKYERIFYYKLSLDVLNTYWNDVKNEEQMIERSANLTPTTMLKDTLWKTGQKLEYNQFLSSIYPNSPFITHFTTNDAVFCLTVAGVDWASSSDPLDSANSPMSVAYALKPSQLNDFQLWLWSDDIIDNLKKWFNDPVSSLISLTMYPFGLNETGHGQDKNIFVGNIPVKRSGTQIRGYAISNSNYEANLGYIDFSSFMYNDFRDYPPYTTYKLWLPYIGFVDLSAPEFYTSKRVYIKYLINVLSGSVLVFLRAQSDSVPHQIITGQMGVTVPITATNKADIQRNIFLSAASLGLTLGLLPSISHSSNVSTFTQNDTTRIFESGNPRRIAEKKTEDINSETVSEYKSGRVGVYGIRSATTFMNSVFQPTRVNVNGNLGGDIYRSLQQYPYAIAYHSAPVDDAKQTAKYGRLIMNFGTPISSGLGYCKIHDCNIPMKGLPTDVYEALVTALEGGFYIKSLA